MIAVPSLLSLTFLGWRALVIQPLKRLAHRGTGLARFQAAYGPDGLVPTRLEDREVALLASRCTGCGLCEAGCLLPGAAPALRALGLPAVFRLAGKQSADLPLGGPARRLRRLRRLRGALPGRSAHRQGALPPRPPPPPGSGPLRLSRGPPRCILRPCSPS
jgi:hypothetical protein